MTAIESEHLTQLIEQHIAVIYPEIDIPVFANRLLEIMELDGPIKAPQNHQNHWDEKDVWVITYGDSILEENEKPLCTLLKFLNNDVKSLINGVHILPFYPYSSDDGFAVIDYVQVNDTLGDWPEIESISTKYRLMADLVVNHCSSRSRWFDNFKNRKDPGLSYFIEADPEEDTSLVVRPRTSTLLREVETLDGKKHVWCTFSHDQVDLNFANPDVLLEMIGIVKYYLDRGITVFRLDAVAFLWKKLGTTCLHLPQTHEIIRLIRTLVEYHTEDAVIITETNVPNTENLSYFGNANEAHGVYNFSLPPLILHALTTGTSKHLKTWQMSMPPAQVGTFYFNFLASHDGIGLRPAEGLLSEEEIGELAATMESFGGKVSWRTANNMRKPYELNITLFDAFKGTSSGQDQWQVQRFLCAHAIMFSLEGIPGVYIHSLVGTENYYEGVEHTSHNRTINRYKWLYPDLQEKIRDEKWHHHRVFEGITKLLEVRREQKAFHPNAVQFTLHVADEIFAYWRQSAFRDQSIFCIHNVSNKKFTLSLASINLIGLDTWRDLISGDVIEDLTAEIELKPYGFIWLTNK